MVLGTLVMIWIKTRIQAPDGVLAGYDAEDLAIYSRMQRSRIGP